MVKIVDVASLAGVSTATVSRVLNRHPRVAEALRLKVESAIAELGYNPNIAARSLRTRQSSKILLSVPDISNPFFGDIIRGAEEAAREAGYSVILGDTGGDPSLEDQYAALLGRQEVDGLIVLGHRLPASICKVIADGATAPAPIIHGCEYSPDIGVPSVHIDNVAAGRDAVEHLLGLGHRRIGAITGPLDSPLSRDRLSGAEQAASGAGCELAVCHGDFTIQSGYDKAGDLVGMGVTAIFCFSDEMAIGAIRALRDLGIDCPGSASVIGFDDIRFAAHAVPRLTTIAQPRRAIGRTTVELLLRRLQGGEVDADSVTLPHRLVVRDSTGPAPSGQTAKDIQHT